MTQRLMFGLPAGNLQESTFDLLAKAGYIVTNDARSYNPVVDDPELGALLIRPQEMSRYVQQGIIDI